MSYVRRHLKLIGVGICCAGIGAGASVIATAGAANSSASAGSKRGVVRKHHARGGFAGLLRRAVQGSAVVYTKKGFETVTFERGFVQSVSGQQLTMTEATKKATYKTVTLTIPANARIRDNRRKASLSDLHKGQQVIVVQLPNRTIVVARDAKS